MIEIALIVTFDIGSHSRYVYHDQHVVAHFGAFSFRNMDGLDDVPYEWMGASHVQPRHATRLYHLQHLA